WAGGATNVHCRNPKPFTWYRHASGDRGMIAVGTRVASRPPLRSVVPNSSIRLPPRVSDGEACIWPGMEDARFREPILDQPHDPFHRRPIFLASPPQRAPPEMGDMEMERGQPRSICRHRVIVEVAGDDLLQPLPLLGI